MCIWCAGIDGIISCSLISPHLSSLSTPSWWTYFFILWGQKSSNQKRTTWQSYHESPTHLHLYPRSLPSLPLQFRRIKLSPCALDLIPSHLPLVMSWNDSSVPRIINFSLSTGLLPLIYKYSVLCCDLSPHLFLSDSLYSPPPPVVVHIRLVSLTSTDTTLAKPNGQSLSLTLLHLQQHLRTQRSRPLLSSWNTFTTGFQHSIPACFPLPRWLHYLIFFLFLILKTSKIWEFSELTLWPCCGHFPP